MKKIIVLTLFSAVINIELYSQHIANGCYTNGNEYICIKGDTILYRDGWYLYKGKFTIEQNLLYWGDNILRGKNVHIIKENCSPDSIELRLITKHKHYLLGMPSSDTNIYEYESDIYTMYLNKTSLVSRDTSGIYIAKGQFSDNILSNGFFLNDSGAGFLDYFSSPLEYGTRYIIKQKYYEFRPIINHTNTCGFLKYYDKSKEIMFKWSLDNEYYTKLKYVSSNVDSCFNELKNKFPLLFE